MLTQVHDFVDGVKLCPENRHTINVTLNDALAVPALQPCEPIPLPQYLRTEKMCGGLFIPHLHPATQWFVFLSMRAVTFGVSNRAETRHIPSGTNALIARMGRARISADAVRQHSRAKWISGV
jgi:hypothetical protein